MTSGVKIPKSAGKFRKDVYELTLRAIKALHTPKVTYRAFGEESSKIQKSTSNRDKALRALTKHA